MMSSARASNLVDDQANRAATAGRRNRARGGGLDRATQHSGGAAVERMDTVDFG